MNEIVNKETSSILNLDEQKKEFDKIYNEIKSIVREIDTTLEEHTEALETKQIEKIICTRKENASCRKKKIFRSEKSIE